MSMYSIWSLLWTVDVYVLHLESVVTRRLSSNLQTLSLLWSNLSMWGHFLIVLNLRKPNPPSIWLCWLTSIQIELLRISSLCYFGDIFNAIRISEGFSQNPIEFAYKLSTLLWYLQRDRHQHQSGGLLSPSVWRSLLSPGPVWLPAVSQ